MESQLIQKALFTSQKLARLKEYPNSSGFRKPVMNYTYRLLISTSGDEKSTPIN